MMNHKRKYLIAPLAAAVIAAFAGAAHADALTSPTPITGMTAITGYCYSLGPIATPSDMDTLTSNVDNAVQEFSAIVQSGVQQQTLAERNLMNQQLQSETATLRNLFITQAQQDYADQVGGINAQSDACTIEDQASKTVAGLNAARAFVAGITKPAPLTGSAAAGANIGAPTVAQQIAPVDNTSAQMAALAKQPVKQWNSSVITQSGGSAADVTAAIAHAVNPIPTKGIPNSALNTNPGLMWQAHAVVNSAQTSLATNALAIQYEGHDATIDGSTAISTLTQDLGGNATTAANVAGITSSGTISPDALFRVLVAGWGKNPTFSDAVRNGGDVWQVKKQAQMLAAKLWADQRINTLLERVVTLQAAMLAQDAEGMVHKVNATQADMTQQTARGLGQ